MAAVLAALLAVIPNVLLAIFAKLVTESFLQSVLEKLLIAGLRRAAAMSTNSIDDEIVADIERRLKTPGAP